MEELDGHPLALATAGAYLNEISTSFAEYLQWYKSSWLKLQQKSPKVGSYEDKKLYSTWNLSLDRISQQNEHSAKLLQLWAYFDNQDLWFELLREGRSSGPEWFLHMTEDDLNFTEALRVLCNYGLAEADRSIDHGKVERQGYKMHSCVHSWTFHMINQEWDAELANLALDCVKKRLPDSNTQEPWVAQRRLMRHVGRCWRFMLDGSLDDSGKEWISYRFGDLYFVQGQLGEVEAMYQQALRGYEKVWGPEHESTLHTINNLGVIYYTFGRLEEAEAMHQRALRGYEKTRGPEHESTFETLNNLGALYLTLGRLEEAMYQRALQGHEKALGRKVEKMFIPTLSIARNLASLFLRTGRAKEAEELYSHTFAGARAAFGCSRERCQNIIKNLNVTQASSFPMDMSLILSGHQ